jgi:hypothetical protein
MSPGLVLISVTSLLAVAVLKTLVTAELRGWVPVVAHWLARRATMRLPEQARGRWLEEWNAELEVLKDRPLTMLAYSAGLGRAARRMHDLGASMPATGEGVAEALVDAATTTVEQVRAARSFVDRLRAETDPGAKPWHEILEEMRGALGSDVERFTDESLARSHRSLTRIVDDAREHGKYLRARQRYLDGLRIARD